MIDRLRADSEFLQKVLTKYGSAFADSGWEGSLDSPDFDLGDNVSVVEDVLWALIDEHGKEADVREWDGGGMPGTAGASWITEFEDRFFVTSSDYASGGPYRSLDEAGEHEAFSDF